MKLEQESYMTMGHQATVVGVFEDRLCAEQAVSELSKAGFREDQIGVAMRHDVVPAQDRAAANEAHGGESAAISGALTGLGLGALTGLGVIAGIVPVIGPAIAAGTLGIIASNAAAGAAIVGLVGALVDAGIPENDARYYQGEFEAGRVVMTIAADERAGEAKAILRRCGAYDTTTRTSANSL